MKGRATGLDEVGEGALSLSASFGMLKQQLH